MENITFLIKTFERPYCVRRLVKSIYRYYPKAKVLIADDSRGESCKQYFAEYYSDKDVSVYELEPDQGLSFGRNFLVDRVTTECFVLLDDDFVFDSRTDIARALEVFKEKNLDILGGYIRNFATRTSFLSLLKLAVQHIILFDNPANYMGTFRYSEDEHVLYIDRIRHQFPDYLETDIVMNFFIAKTAVVRDTNRWDEELKLQEHTAFFFKAKQNGLKVAFSNVFSVQHKPIRIKDYGSFRGRDYFQLFLEKYNIQKVVSCDDDGTQEITVNEKFIQ